MILCIAIIKTIITNRAITFSLNIHSISFLMIQLKPLNIHSISFFNDSIETISILKRGGGGTRP